MVRTYPTRLRTQGDNPYSRQTYCILRWMKNQLNENFGPTLTEAIYFVLLVTGLVVALQNVIVISNFVSNIFCLYNRLLIKFNRYLNYWFLFCLLQFLMALLWPLAAVSVFLILNLPPCKTFLVDHFPVNGQKYLYDTCIRKVMVGLNKTMCYR